MRVARPGGMTKADLAAYRAPFRPPAVTTYRGLEMNGMGPPSSGGSTIGEALNILEGYDPLGATRTEAYHRFLEASALSFADRGAFLGDADFIDIPLEGLLDKAYAAERRTLIGPTASTKPLAAGNPWPYQTGPPTAVREREDGSTTHLTVSDKWGNVVSYTFTIESIGGNGIVAGQHGFLLNNELTDFEFTPGLPNSPAGGKRPRSSMSPTIMVSALDGRPRLALGSPGGSMIITTVLQVLVERLDFGKSLPDAIATPRASQRNTVSVSAEPAFVSSPEGIALQALGHRFAAAAEIGAVTGIEFFRPTAVPQVQAGAEPVRRGGGNAQVAPARAARACLLAPSPRALRAGARTTLTMRLRRTLGMPAPTGTRIALRGAGVSRTVRTNAAGTARVSLTPRRAGRLTVTVPSLGRCVTTIRVGAAGAGAGRLTGARG
jgi:gamma-glutamyltranspeptidase/glutathione hydrolase